MNASIPTRQDAETAAYDLLLSTWAEDLKTCPLPIDPFGIAGMLGLQVMRVPLEPDVSGMLAKHPGRDPEVYLNMSDSEARQRFSCAHEIGHYIRRSSVGASEEEWGYIDRRGPAAARGDNPEEIYANQFAAALLMPEERVRTLASEGMSAVTLAFRFSVSLEAMALRIKNLRLTGQVGGAWPDGVS